jgi:hypothetical protein
MYAWFVDGAGRVGDAIISLDRSYRSELRGLLGEILVKVEAETNRRETQREI